MDGGAKIEVKENGRKISISLSSMFYERIDRMHLNESVHNEIEWNQNDNNYVLYPCSMFNVHVHD